MAKFTVYHNPKCSKSRSALKLLEEKNLDVQVIEYLNDTIKAKDIEEIISKAIDFEIKDMIRTKEAKEEGLETKALKDMNAGAFAKEVVKHPRILQRPIVIKDKQAVIARDDDWFKKLK